MKYIAIITAAILTIASCSDIFERNLSKSEITLLAPADGLQTTIVTQTFWWEEVKGADQYNIQIVSPDFKNIARFVLDSSVTGDKFTHTLLPGQYQWRVRAENGSSSTDFKTRTLVIDSTPDISQQQIVLTSPSEGLVTSDSTFTFTWEELYNADNYSFEIWSPDFETGTAVVGPVVLDDTEITKTLAEGEYEWGVRGQNEFSNTAYFKRLLQVDNTPPNMPVLIAPTKNDSITDPTPQFEWDRGTETGSSISDSLLVFSDTSNWTIAIEEFTTSASFTAQDSLAQGDYFWLVRSIDAAGNKSPYSDLWKFTVK